jgi:sugar phosphate permease
MPRGYPRYVLAVMVGINFLNYLDRWILTGAGSVVQREFSLSDAQFGLLATAFLLVYAVGALPFGVWADRGVRRTIIGVGVLIWGISTALTGFVTSYLQLFITRAMVGIGEATYYPAGTSLLSDYFPRSSRSRAMSIWNVGAMIGIAVGFGAGGVFATSRFGWRGAFFFTAIPGVIFAALAFTMREPLRGAAEARGPVVGVAREASLRAFARLWRIPTLRATIIAQAMLFFVLAANAAWLPISLVRRFGLSPGNAAILAGGGIVLGGLVGTLLGGYLADWRARKTAAGPMEVTMAGLLLAAAASALAIAVPVLAFVVPVFIATVAFLSVYSGPFTAVSQNVVIPSLRASAVTLTLFLAHLFGDSWAPLAVGGLSDLFQRFGYSNVVSLQVALFATSPPLLLLAAWVTYRGSKTVKVDVANMERGWEMGPTMPVPVEVAP